MPSLIQRQPEAYEYEVVSEAKKDHLWSYREVKAAVVENSLSR